MRRTLLTLGLLASFSSAAIAQDTPEQTKVRERLRTGISKKAVELPIKRSLTDPRLRFLKPAEMRKRMRTGISKGMVERPLEVELLPPIRAPKAKNKKAPDKRLRTGISKSRVEQPLELELEKTPLRTGISKRKVEAPIERAISRRAPRRSRAVEPGKVRWHRSFEEACRAAKLSGKPVLLFHTIGRLDEEFC